MRSKDWKVVEMLDLYHKTVIQSGKKSGKHLNRKVIKKLTGQCTTPEVRLKSDIRMMMHDPGNFVIT